MRHRYSEPQLDGPESFWAAPLEVLTEEQRISFEEPPQDARLARNWQGRAFMNLIVGMDKTWDAESGWHVLQPGRYRYVVAQPGVIVVRIVISEYLAAEIVW